MHRAMVRGYGTRDLCGPAGLTTEQFVDYIARRINKDEELDSSDEEDELLYNFSFKKLLTLSVLIYKKRFKD